MYVVRTSEYKSGDDTLTQGFAAEVPCILPRPSLLFRGSVNASEVR